MNTNSKHPLAFIVHTSFVSVQDLTALFQKHGPGIEVRHIVDDSLLAEVLANKGVTAAVRTRMRQYFKAAEVAGADLIFNQCSSVGEAADDAARTVRVPVVKVDSAMAEAACRMGRRVGVVATLKTTLGPTCRLVEATARRLRKRIKITRCLVTGAFATLVEGDRAGHNRKVIAAIRQLTRKVDVVICAQGSMAAILPKLGKTNIPVLTSPELGVANAVAVIGRHASKPKRPPIEAHMNQPHLNNRDANQSAPQPDTCSAGNPGCRRRLSPVLSKPHNPIEP
jgi:Asp/Glu/hydantoin racemase